MLAKETLDYDLSIASVLEETTSATLSQLDLSASSSLSSMLSMQITVIRNSNECLFTFLLIGCQMLWWLILCISFVISFVYAYMQIQHMWQHWKEVTPLMCISIVYLQAGRALYTIYIHIRIILNTDIFKVSYMHIIMFITMVHCSM